MRMNLLEKKQEQKNPALMRNRKEEAPKFGRLEVKSTHSNTLRTRNSNPSKNDVDRMVNQFMNNSSHETMRRASALIDLLLIMVRVLCTTFLRQSV